MLSGKSLKEEFLQIKGKTIAIVYIFEGDNSSGFEHFFIWKSDIISLWLKAIQELNCFPLILDVRTFVDKAMNNTLPCIDYVLNLNSGTYNLSTMALIPSVCSSIGVPCIPCDSTTIVTGENKKLSNFIANAIGINVPKTLEKNVPNGIFRPINLGNSLGVVRNFNDQCEGIYQEFVEGYDITTPVVYNSITKRMDLLPTVMYLPNTKDLTWYNGEVQKLTREGYKFKIVELDDAIKQKYLELVNDLSIKTFCRIDSRVHSQDNSFYFLEENIIVEFKNTFFIEINVMPTIREFNNFVFSFNSIEKSNSIYKHIEMQKEVFGSVNLNSFLLSSSMMNLKPCTK